MVSDKELLQRIQQGDKRAFEMLFRRYFERITYFLWGYVQSKSVAEGLSQDVFAKIWKKRNSLKQEGSVKTFIYRIARNLAIDELRHRKVVRDWEEEEKSRNLQSVYDEQIDDQVNNKLLLEKIRQTIEAMPDRRRVVFVMSRYNQMSYKEIANILDISVNTVETQIRRALEELRNKFEDQYQF